MEAREGMCRAMGDGDEEEDAVENGADRLGVEEERGGVDTGRTRGGRLKGEEPGGRGGAEREEGEERKDEGGRAGGGCGEDAREDGNGRKRGGRGEVEEGGKGRERGGRGEVEESGGRMGGEGKVGRESEPLSGDLAHEGKELWLSVLPRPEAVPTDAAGVAEREPVAAAAAAAAGKGVAVAVAAGAAGWAKGEGKGTLEGHASDPARRDGGLVSRRQQIVNVLQQLLVHLP
ncbi:unnamed protein product [Closterium sp. NIES-65]|nr:unnamed protein product [Closterium sp. NIES-65]